jgi:hypothetical protein
MYSNPDPHGAFSKLDNKELFFFTWTSPKTRMITGMPHIQTFIFVFYLKNQKKSLKLYTKLREADFNA